MQSLDDLYGGWPVAFGEGGNVLGQFDADHQAKPAHFLQNSGMRLDQCLDSLGQMAAQRNGVLREPIAFDDL